MLGKRTPFLQVIKLKRLKSVFICKGRIDKMVKISGYRIEIPDVEANLKINYIKDVIIFEKKIIV